MHSEVKILNHAHGGIFVKFFRFFIFTARASFSDHRFDAVVAVANSHFCGGGGDGGGGGGGAPQAFRLVAKLPDLPLV